MSAAVTMLPLESIRLDGGTQAREALNQSIIKEYKQDFAQWETNGEETRNVGATKFPPIIVFYDGTDYWLADGFHRTYGAIYAGVKEIAAEVRQGSRRDAVLYSCGANAVHGLRRSNADKRRAVLTLLRDEEWARESDRWIAKVANVSHTFVSWERQKLHVATLPVLPPAAADEPLATGNGCQSNETEPAEPASPNDADDDEGNRAPESPIPNYPIQPLAAQEWEDLYEHVHEASSAMWHHVQAWIGRHVRDAYPSNHRNARRPAGDKRRLAWEKNRDKFAAERRAEIGRDVEILRHVCDLVARLVALHAPPGRAKHCAVDSCNRTAHHVATYRKGEPIARPPNRRVMDQRLYGIVEAFSTGGDVLGMVAAYEAEDEARLQALESNEEAAQ